MRESKYFVLLASFNDEDEDENNDYDIWLKKFKEEKCKKVDERNYRRASIDYRKLFKTEH